MADNLKRKNVQYVDYTKVVPWEIEREHEQRTKRPVRRVEQQENAEVFSFSKFIVMSGLIISIVALLIVYVSAINSNQAIKTEVTNLQQQLNNQKTKNNYTKNKIDESIDYNAIYIKAVNILGMKEPTREQLINYKQVEREYVRQYGDIPE